MPPHLDCWLPGSACSGGFPRSTASWGRRRDSPTCPESVQRSLDRHSALGPEPVLGRRPAPRLSQPGGDLRALLPAVPPAASGWPPFPSSCGRLLALPVHSGCCPAVHSQPAAWGFSELCGFNLCPHFHHHILCILGESLVGSCRTQRSFEAQQAKWNPITTSFGIELDLELLLCSFSVPVKYSLDQGICSDFLVLHSQCLKAAWNPCKYSR